VHAIVFDLETSDKITTGQILNYSFILIDETFQQVGELSGLVRLSRLELPSPEAILTNRIFLPEHQRLAEDDESEFVKKLDNWFSHVIASVPTPIALIGFNSARFDLPFLRTVFIRNGVSPFYRELVPKDILFAAQKAFLSNPEFQEKILSSKGEKLSLSLSSVTKALGLLTKAQSHESRDDVLLSIELMKMLRERFAVCSVTLESYEAATLHVRGAIAFRAETNYEEGGEPVVAIPMACLDFDHRQALWIDLNRFSAVPEKSSIRWFTKQRHTFFLSTGQEVKYLELRDRAMKEFANVRLSNFFERSDCDIEVDIHRLDFDGIRSLGEAIVSGDKSKLKGASRDALVLWLRYQLRSKSFNYSEPKSLETLKTYLDYRYGGAMIISKREPIERHETLEDRMSRISSLLAERTDPEDQHLLLGLKDIYEQSLAISGRGA
jgi:hypothetical protein